MNLEGDLSRIRLPKVLLGIGAHQATGILTVQGAEDIVAVSFVEGSIVTADALNQTVEEGLGRVLQAKGWLQGDDFQTALREYQGGSSGSLGDHLIERGLIDRDQLLEALREQTLASMMQLLGWKTGEFKFYSGDEVSFEEGFLPISVDELLVSAIDRLGERVGLVGSIPSAAGAFRQVPPRGPVQVFGKDGDGMSAGIWVTEKQAAFLSSTDGRRAANDIARELGLNRYQAQFTLYYLTQYDLIEATGKAGREARGAAAPSAPMPGAGRAPAPAAAAQAAASPMAPGQAGRPPASSDRIPFGEDSQISLQPPASDEAPASDGIMVPPDPSVRPGQIKAEIFRPPDDLEESRAGRSVQPVGAGALLDWAAAAMAVILLLALGAVMTSRPVSTLLPFPWQDNERHSAENKVRDALFQRIDRAARTFFLLEARYPDRLDELVDYGLLLSDDLQDPGAHELTYETNGVSYSIRLKSEGQAIEGLGTTEAITGDFLVDPQFLSEAAQAQAPLVLLD